MAISDSDFWLNAMCVFRLSNSDYAKQHFALVQKTALASRVIRYDIVLSQTVFRFYLRRKSSTLVSAPSATKLSPAVALRIGVASQSSELQWYCPHRRGVRLRPTVPRWMPAREVTTAPSMNCCAAFLADSEKMRHCACLRARE